MNWKIIEQSKNHFNINIFEIIKEEMTPIKNKNYNQKQSDVKEEHKNMKNK